jgi:hypothetical protein
MKTGGFEGFCMAEYDSLVERLLLVVRFDIRRYIVVVGEAGETLQLWDIIKL